MMSELEEDDYGIPNWVLEEEERRYAERNRRSFAAKQELWNRQKTLARRVREQSKRFGMTPLLFHGTTNLNAILADGWLAAGVPRILGGIGGPENQKECVCFTRSPEIGCPLNSVTFGRRRQDATLIFDWDRLRARYKVRPIVSTILYRDFDGERMVKHEKLEEERIYAQKVLLKHGLLAIVEAPKLPRRLEVPWHVMRREARV